DPTSDDMELQLSNGNGEVLCALLPKGSWSKRKKSFKFSDKTGSAGGLSSGAMSFKKKGAIAVLTLTGKHIDLSGFTDPSYTATRRAGNQGATGRKRRGHCRGGLRPSPPAGKARGGPRLPARSARPRAARAETPTRLGAI